MADQRPQLTPAAQARFAAPPAPAIETPPPVVHPAAPALAAHEDAGSDGLRVYDAVPTCHGARMAYTGVVHAVTPMKWGIACESCGWTAATRLSPAGWDEQQARIFKAANPQKRSASS